MEPFHKYMNEYRKQLEKGSIKAAYRGLMEYFNTLRLYLRKKYPNYFVSGSVYPGYMDMTYFSFFPKSFKRRKLKIAIVFLHEAFRFEVWLAGHNRTVQTKYCKLFTKSGWNKYHISTPAKGVDAILDQTIVDNPDFSDLDTLTRKIENSTLIFIRDVESFVQKYS